MPLPESFAIGAFAAGIATNLASDILTHRASSLDNSLIGKALKWAGFAKPDFQERLQDVLKKALEIYFEDFPERQALGVDEFFQKSTVIEQISGAILNRLPLDETTLQDAWEEHLSDKPIFLLLSQQQSLSAGEVVSNFLDCYQRVLRNQQSVPELAIAYDLLGQSEEFIRELRASEERLESYISELLKHRSEAYKQSFSFYGREIEQKVKVIIDEYIGQPFAGRSDEQLDIYQFFEMNKKGVLLVTAPAGFGKSALLINWMQRHQEDFHIVFHCFRSDSNIISSLQNGYRHLLRQLLLYYKQDYREFPSDENGMRDLLCDLIQSGVSEGNRLIIMLDGLDEADKVLEPFWGVSLPDGVYVVASARADKDDKPDYLRDWVECTKRVQIKQLSINAIIDWVGRINELSPYAKDDNFIKTLYRVTEGFPLYLRYLLDDLKLATLQEKDIRSLAAKSADGFTAYVKGQFRLIAKLEEVKQKSGIQELFALLTIALGALPENDIQAIVNLNSWDLEALPFQITRWFNIRSDSYSFSHPLLAKEFKSAIGRQVVAVEDKLLKYCADWPSHSSLYALRHYVDHLKHKEQWDDLYELARSEAFIEAQKEYLPKEPNASLKAIEIALMEKAKANDAAQTVEFLLRHAYQVSKIVKKENPLFLARKDNLSGALMAANNYDKRLRALWYLLILWELKDLNRLRDLDSVIRQLSSQPLPRFNLYSREEGGLARQGGGLAVFLLASISDILTCELYFKVCFNLLDEHLINSLCHVLAKANETSLALGLARKIKNDWLRESSLGDIIEALVTRENFISALEILHELPDEFSIHRIEALKIISKQYADIGDFKASFENAQKITSKAHRVVALVEIAKFQVEASYSSLALQTTDLALDIFNSTLCSFRNTHWPCQSALTEIAKIRIRFKGKEYGISTFEEVLKNAQGKTHDRQSLLEDIANVQFNAGLHEEAWKTSQYLNDDGQNRIKQIIDNQKSKSSENRADLEKRIDSSIYASKVNNYVKESEPLENDEHIRNRLSMDLDSFSSFRTFEKHKVEAPIVATIFAHGKHFSKAIQIAESIEDCTQKFWNLLRILRIQRSQIAKLDSDILLKIQTIIEGFENQQERLWALSELIKVLVEFGEFACAFDISKRSVIEFELPKLLKEIAIGLIAHDRMNSVDKILGKIYEIEDKFSDESGRQLINYSQSCEVVSVIKARRGEFEIALQEAKKIKAIPARQRVIGKIALEQVKAGQLETALSMLDQEYNDLSNQSHPFLKVESLADIAIYKSKFGEKKLAHQIFCSAKYDSSLFNSEYDQSVAFSVISQAQIQAGFSEQAIETSRQILVDVHKHLPQIALTFVEKGDSTNFKRLLLSCSYCLESACNMCMHFAQLYPEQSEAIAKTVSCQLSAF